MTKFFASRRGASKRGFTLIELLVVIAIIGVLASIVLASLNTARRKSRDARRIADIKQIQLALELYFDANSGNYPQAIYVTCAAQGAAGITNPLCPAFIPAVPKDPIGQTNYSYSAFGTASTCTSYHLGASLEESTNPALNSDIDAAAAVSGLCGTSAADFSGADSGKCATGDSGSSCYDVKP